MDPTELQEQALLRDARLHSARLLNELVLRHEELVAHIAAGTSASSESMAQGRAALAQAIEAARELTEVLSAAHVEDAPSETGLIS